MSLSPPGKNDNLQQLEKKSAHGIKWVGIAEIFIRILQYGTTLVLVHLLLPTDFGVFSIALIFTQLAYVLFDFGFSTALLQRKEVSDIHFSTTFVLYLASAVLYAIIVYFLSPSIALFFDKAVLSKILRVLIIIFFLYAFNAMPRVRLQREMRFKRFGILQVIGVFAYSVITLFFALTGNGVWSFIYGILAEQISLTLLLNIFAWWRPSLRFSKSAFSELFSFSARVLGTRMVGYVNANIPSFLIGKILGANVLGFYSVAYQFVEFPVQRIAKNVLRVMFPAFSKLQDDQEAYQSLYKSTVYYLGLVLLPLFAGVVLVAPNLVHLLYGPKWEPAIIPLQLLALAGFFRSIWATVSVVYLSMGRPQTELKINIGFAVALLPGVYIAAHVNLNAVAAMVSVLLAIFLGIAQVNALKIIKLRWRDLIRVFRLPVVAVGSFVIAYMALRFVGIGHWTDGLQLLVIVVSSAVLYMGIVLRKDREILRKALKLLRGNL